VKLFLFAKVIVFAKMTTVAKKENSEIVGINKNIGETNLLN